MSKLIITSSREPSRRTRSFIKDLVKAIPNSLRFNRGKATLDDLASIARRNEAHAVMIILEKKGNPSAIVHYEPAEEGLVKKALMKITGVKLLREIRGGQTPYNIKTIVLNPQKINEEMQLKVANFLAALLKTAPKPPDLLTPAIEVSVGSGEEPTVRFICLQTQRICGPQFKVLKVINYPRGGKRDQGGAEAEEA